MIDMQKRKIVFFTGAGMSAESGLPTFRDSNGLWHNHKPSEVASKEAWEKSPEMVTEFYNERRRKLCECEPNEGHRIIAQLEKDYEVTVITQNIDNLHERAGSTTVKHLHGELMKVRSSLNRKTDVRTLTKDNCIVPPGTLASDGSLLRPDVVMFGEVVPGILEAGIITSNADLLIIVGTSLTVSPAKDIVECADRMTKIIQINPKPVELDVDSACYVLETGAVEGLQALVEILKSGEI